MITDSEAEDKNYCGKTNMNLTLVELKSTAV